MIKKSTCGALAALQLFLCMHAHGAAPASASRAAPKAYEIERTQILEIRSEILKRTYELYIKLPASYSTDKNRRYPVVFLNDAQYSFPLACSLSQQLMNAGRIEEVILVGVSYAKGVDPDVSRTRDYTPTNSPNEPIGHSPEAKQLSGEAPRYLRFLTDEVVPLIAKEFRIDQKKKTLTGHSFGGLLSAYALLAAPGSFENYLVSDPSLWYDDEVIFKLAKETQIDKSRTTNVLVINANPDLSQRSDKKQTARLSNMASRGERFGGLMVERLGERAAWRTFDGEIHETIFPIALSHALLRFHGKR